jgi:hypothetical protein
MKLIITVNLDPGDVPEIRKRVTNMHGYIGQDVVRAVRAVLLENLWFSPEYHNINPETFRPAKVGRITTRLEAK